MVTSRRGTRVGPAGAVARSTSVGAVRSFSLSAVGRDRPGIVAAVTGVLAEHGGNLQDSTMATLQGQFAIVLIVSVGDDVDAGAIEADLQPVAQHFDLLVAVRELADGPERTGPAEGPGAGRAAVQVAVHGADRPGIVHGITTALAESGGNIVDLVTHLVGPPDRPVYTLTIRATVPEAAAGSVADRLAAAADALGVRCTVRPDDADVL